MNEQLDNILELICTREETNIELAKMLLEGLNMSEEEFFKHYNIEDVTINDIGNSNFTGAELSIEYNTNILPILKNFKDIAFYRIHINNVNDVSFMDKLFTDKLLISNSKIKDFDLKFSIRSLYFDNCTIENIIEFPFNLFSLYMKDTIIKDDIIDFGKYHHLSRLEYLTLLNTNLNNTPDGKDLVNLRALEYWNKYHKIKLKRHPYYKKLMPIQKYTDCEVIFSPDEQFKSFITS